MDGFDAVVGTILNNWTALKLAVDHGMGGDNPKVLLESMISKILEYLNRKDVDSLPDLLEDILDDDFNTLLEDNSADEVSRDITNVFGMWSEGRRDEVTLKIQSLPTKTSILDKYERLNPAYSRKAETGSVDDEQSSDSSNDDMETNNEDSEWTVVTRKK